MQELIKLIFTSIFSEYGVIGASFVVLLLWTMKENKDRESKYQDTIAKNQEIILEQARNFDVVKEIREDVSELKVAITTAKAKRPLRDRHT